MMAPGFENGMRRIVAPLLDAASATISRIGKLDTFG
jgi:hypothetical protein